MNTPLVEYRFHYYQGGIKVKKPTEVVDLAEVVGHIRSDRYAESIRSLRALPPEAQKLFKQDLDYYTFSGTFTPTRLAKNLYKHSGLICLDFDDLGDVETARMQFESDPYCLVCFVSPSGTGLKWICAVAQPERHTEAFADLGQYMFQTYGYRLDASGADVSRACFVSYDPAIYVNEQAEPYQIRGLVLRAAKAKPPTDQQVIKNASQVYKHVAAVVERIVAGQVDISGGSGQYDNRLLIAFCMSTLGEDGRALLHQVFQFYANYTVEETDAKFDEGVNKSRFTTPWKFFDIAKEHGVDVSKPGSRKKDAEKTDTTVVIAGGDSEPGGRTQTDNMPSQEPTEGKKRKHILDNSDSVYYYLEEHKIRIKGGKNNFNTVAENFLLYVKYLTEDEYENLTWVLEIRPGEGDPIYVEVPHDDFTSASRLKKIVTGKRYALKISDGELSELHGYLFTRTKFAKATKIIRYGYHLPSGVFFFSNVAVTRLGEQIRPDSFNMIEAMQGDQRLHLSMPANNKHKAHRYALTESRVSVNEFFRVYAQAHTPENALLPFCFYLMSLFRDVAIRHKNFSPILFLKGGAGTGKSSMVRVMTAAYGRKQEGVNLKSKNTESALVKLMGQASNMMIWFDEFHNELGSTEGLLQAAYDNDGYHLSKAGTTGTNETDAMEIHSALALTSNYLPQNPIFFSRCVFIPISSQDKSADQRAAFNQLEAWQDEGLGSLTLELLPHRALIEKEYGAAYDLLYRHIKAQFQNEKVPERFFANMAQLLSTAFVLASGKVIQITETTETTQTMEILADLVEAGAACIRRQHRIMAEKTGLSVFFEIVQQLYDQYQVHEETHFEFQKIGDTTWVYVWFPQLYNLYAQHFRRIYQAAPADRDELQTELAVLEGYPDWESMKTKKRFKNDGESKSAASTLPRDNSCKLNYSKLGEVYGLNLEHRKAKN